MSTGPAQHHGDPDRFEGYRDLFEELRETHPQRCELSRDEFAAALGDPATVCGFVTTPRGPFELPQLVRVEVNSWLNTAYYERHFPGASASGKLLHLQLWPDHEPEGTIRSRLARLASDGGTVVMDGPSDGRWSVRRAIERLEEILPTGSICSSRLLGTQTYWSGPTSIEGLVVAEEPVSLEAAAVALGRDSTAGGTATGAYLRRHLSEAEADAMFEMYSSAYAVLAEHPCAQGVTPEEFRHMMVDDPSMTKLVFQREGTVESMCLITPEISSLDWINPEFYAKRFGDALTRGRIHWYPAIATDPGSSGARNAEYLIRLIGELYEQSANPAIILFDTPDMNSEFLPAYLTQVIRQVPQHGVEFEVIAEHEYHAVQLGA